MKKSVAVLALLVITSCPAYAEDPAAQPEGQPASEQASDPTAAIRERVAAYVAAYNQHDAAALAELWADDAVYLNHNTGESVVGRSAIAQMFGEMFKAGEADQLNVTVESLRLITPEVAIEDGTAELISFDGRAAPSTYTAVHVNKDGKWYLTSVRETEIPAAAETGEDAQQSGELEQLAWMVGEWIDQDEQSSVRTTCNWAKSGKFLTSNFEVHTEDGVALEGTQVIGWDPVSRSIHSWLFDSGGGFGEGVWRREGNEWVVELKTTQADGSQATSTNVYALQDDKTFTWRSANRQVDGEEQPDIEEMPVYRQ